MRAFFLLVLLAGLAMAGAYPFYINNYSGAEIGEWTVFKRGGAYQTVNVPLTQDQGPVRVFVDVTIKITAPITPNVSVVTLTANLGGRTVLAKAMDFVDTRRNERSPQQQQIMMRGQAGVIDPVESGTYQFVIGPGEIDGLLIDETKLVLREHSLELDPRAQPVGFILIAVGLIGFTLSLRRRNKPDEPRQDDPPPTQHWGRGAS